MDVAYYAAILVACAVLAWWAWRLDPPGRTAKLSRFARRNGYRFNPTPRVLAGRWSGLASLRAGRNTIVENMVEGERDGRRFAAFDCRCEADGGPDASAMMGGILEGRSVGPST